jgi:hypothetical protein
MRLLVRPRFRLVAATIVVAMLLAPRAVEAFRRYRDANRRAKVRAVLTGPITPADEEHLHTLVDLDDDEERADAAGAAQHEDVWDDALRRTIANREAWGTPTPEVRAEWMRVARGEHRRWAALLAPAPAPGGAMRPAIVAPTGTPAWATLGPSGAAFEWNGTSYVAVDSGRVSDIRVHPADPSVVYVATSGGGVWKTFDFGPSPTWLPITETLGNLAIGAMDLDRTAPDTLYVGLGDAFDEGGGFVAKTTDGGSSWSTPVQLAGTYAFAAPLAVVATRVYSVAVDPLHPEVVLAGTDVGLFRSTDAGTTFALVDLPNQGTQAAEAVWSIAVAGQSAGVTRWAVSGVYSGQTSNPGDVWLSADGGATWSSRWAAGALPAVAPGRITLAASSPPPGSPAVIYAFVGSADGNAQLGYWRSTDGGASFLSVASALSNPTTSTDCRTVAVGDAQTWYNQAIAVDPGAPNDVLVGGMLCGLRTRNGLGASVTWDNVAHWLPSGGGGNVASGKLPYVHADWHAVAIVRLPGGAIRVLAGTDGGIAYSDDVFVPATVDDTTVHWTGTNGGIVTHLAYSIASGDPADGTAPVAFTGLQDNGTRFRDPATPTTFNQVIGGDGLGVTLARATGGTVYWASVNGAQRFCLPATAAGSCNAGGAWTQKVPSTTSCSGDAAPFITRYDAVPTNLTVPTVLTYTNRAVFRLASASPGSAAWVRVSPCTTRTFRGLPRAHPTIDGLYGAPLTGGKFLVTSTCAIGAATPCAWTETPNPLGLDLSGNGAIETSEQVVQTSSLDFPPTTPQGKNPGDVFIAASAAPVTAAGGPVPPALGHLFLTNDAGVTWVPLHGNGTGLDLPNVPVQVVRYDPGDATNQTIYAGTDLGLYRSTDGGQTWARFGVGLPLVRVTDLFIGRTGGLLRVATYGRGIWEIYPSATAAHGVAGNGDFDRNQLIDFFDAGALAARLGADPSQTVQPAYDWNLDLTGSVNAIDEQDLAALLAKIGGRP